MPKARPRVLRFVHRSQRNGNIRFLSLLLCSPHYTTWPPQRQAGKNEHLPWSGRRAKAAEGAHREQVRTRTLLELHCCILRDHLHTLMAWPKLTEVSLSQRSTASL